MSARLPVLPLPLRKRLLNSYLSSLSSRPLLTKSLTLGWSLTRPSSPPISSCSRTPFSSRSPFLLRPIPRFELPRHPRLGPWARVLRPLVGREAQQDQEQVEGDGQRGKGEEVGDDGGVRGSA